MIDLLTAQYFNGFKSNFYVENCIKMKQGPVEIKYNDVLKMSADFGRYYLSLDLIGMGYHVTHHTPGSTIAVLVFGVGAFFLAGQHLSIILQHSAVYRVGTTFYREFSRAEKYRELLSAAGGIFFVVGCVLTAVLYTVSDEVAYRLSDHAFVAIIFILLSMLLIVIIKSPHPNAFPKWDDLIAKVEKSHYAVVKNSGSRPQKKLTTHKSTIRTVRRPIASRHRSGISAQEKQYAQ